MAGNAARPSASRPHYWTRALLARSSIILYFNGGRQCDSFSFVLAVVGLSWLAAGRRGPRRHASGQRLKGGTAAMV